jgi:hypothetical protein
MLSRIVALTSVLAAGAAEAADPNPRDLVDRSIQASRLDGSESLATLTILNAKGQKRERTIASVQRLYDGGKTEKRLIRFTAPADVKGTGLLTYDYETKTDDMWLFLPALRKTRRIVASEKAKSFMGSEFSYADITPPALDDFTYTLLGSGTVDGVNCWKVEYAARTEEISDENGYSKRVAWIGKADYAVRKAVYYDVSGELLKELTVVELKELAPGKVRFTHIEMDNKQNGRRSIMKTHEIRLRADVPDEYFSTRYLERQ